MTGRIELDNNKRRARHAAGLALSRKK